MRRGEWDDFSDDDLRRTFVKYGEIDEKMSYMIRDGQTQQHKGYGFVAFRTAGRRVETAPSVSGRRRVVATVVVVAVGPARLGNPARRAR